MVVLFLLFGLGILFIWRVIVTLQHMEECGESGQISMGWRDNDTCYEIRDSQAQ